VGTPVARPALPTTENERIAHDYTIPAGYAHQRHHQKSSNRSSPPAPSEAWPFPFHPDGREVKEPANKAPWRTLEQP
jgi:hypothetical protein